MLYAGLSILVLLNLLWLALVLFGLPGNWLMVLSTALFAWWTSDRQTFSGGVLIASAVLVAVGELLEFLGGLAGALIGTVVTPVLLVGTLVGASVGAGMAVWFAETSRGAHPELSRRRAGGPGWVSSSGFSASSLSG
jgi:hypothetical protein